LVENFDVFTCAVAKSCSIFRKVCRKVCRRKALLSAGIAIIAGV
jgi:hypothetical protein